MKGKVRFSEARGLAGYIVVIIEIKKNPSISLKFRQNGKKKLNFKSLLVSDDLISLAHQN